MFRSQRLRAFGIRLVLVFGGLVVALVLLEVLLRLGGVAYPQPYFPDPRTGWHLQPGWSGWFTKEGRAYVRVNRAGFRGREHDLLKPADTLRVLVLGDSYVEAAQVSEEQTFWAVLETELQRKLQSRGKSVEVISMGVSGWGTAQQYLALQHYGLAYSPDVVLVAFFAGNDIRNNSKRLEPEQARPFFQVAGEDLELDDSFLTSPLFLKAQSRSTRWKVALINRSRLLQWIQEYRSRFQHARQIQAAGINAGLDEVCSLEPADDAWKEAWTISERLLVKMHEACRAREVQFAVALVPTAIQVHPEKAVRDAYCSDIDVKTLDYSDRRVTALGREYGFPVYALADPLRTYAEHNQQYLHGFDNTILGQGHWNATGHRVVGEGLAARVMELFTASSDDEFAEGQSSH